MNVLQIKYGIIWNSKKTLNGKQVVPKDYNAQREITLTLVRYKAEYVKAFCETVHFDPNTGQIIHTLNAVTNID